MGDIPITICFGGIGHSYRPMMLNYAEYEAAWQDQVADALGCQREPTPKEADEIAQYASNFHKSARRPKALKGR